jgi:5-methylcytosine-specific restriction endonuclease McrA
MAKTKKCPRCTKILPLDMFADTGGATNSRGRYCAKCHAEKVLEWRKAAIEAENTLIRKLQIVYGDYWRHYTNPDDFYRLLRDERNYCLYCGTSFEGATPDHFAQSSIHLDHMDPLERGGEHSIRNVVFCCGPCNIKKGWQPFTKWLKSLSYSCRELSRQVYIEKHGHSPEDFIEGCPQGRGSNDIELACFKTEEELMREYPQPIVDGPPSNQPIIISIDIGKFPAITCGSAKNRRGVANKSQERTE